MDAIFVDTENSGQVSGDHSLSREFLCNPVQAQIVTCSGAFNTGSLRIIRHGVDLEELAVVNDMIHVKLMWPLKSSYEAQCV